MDAGQATRPRQEVAYICGECGVDNVIKPREPIRCKECGYRVMYKKRTKRSTDELRNITGVIELMLCAGCCVQWSNSRHASERNGDFLAYFRRRAVCG
ncbi:DNA directed RNA polymerase [Cladochytrium replicatum]|nr:DNA directed RNA polymerase [Cladochytrium replicatum]